MSKRVLVALSGGVDSAVAALILKNKGYEVEGGTMLLNRSKNAGLETVAAAKKAAEDIGIPHRIYDLSDEFEKYVITPFAEEYKNGHTPNPCVNCNKYLKFGALYDCAMTDGFDFISTGHYAEVVKKDDLYALRVSPAGNKDQTYMLYNLTQEILSRLLLPLGEMNKEQVRKIAEENNLSAAELPDSEDICFVPSGDYIYFLNKLGIIGTSGKMIFTDGRIAGKHNGILNYTVGQRKGIGGGFDKPYYVTAVNATENTVTIGTNDELFSDTVICENEHWIGNPPENGSQVMVKIRYNAHATKGIINLLKNGGFTVDFDSPVRAVTPGQSAVVYKDEYLLGGGIIK